MYILVQNEINTKVIDDSKVLIQISSDGKTFTVIKHENFRPAEGSVYHMSELKHILTAGPK